MGQISNGQLVSCIMPTKARRQFVPQAVAYFLRQDYEPRELIVVDDGPQPVDDLLPDDPRIRYLRLDRELVIGEKRNLACEAASGPIIAHWDDDDWMAPWRLAYQVQHLVQAQADLCGLDRVLFYDAAYRRGWQYVYPRGKRPWVYGGTLCYTKAFWQANRFRHIDEGEDSLFVWYGGPKVAVLEDNTCYVGLIHAANTSTKQTSNSRWSRVPGPEIERLLGEDRDFYHALKQHSTAITAKTVNMSPVRSTAKREMGETVSEADHSAASPAIRNVYACLVHEKRDCIVDLVRNLRHFDPDSQILLYNGGEDPQLLCGGFPFERYGAIILPDTRPLQWGRLHDFALDSLRFALQNLNWDTLTIVDSDQLALRPGYSQFLAQILHKKENVGLLSSVPVRQAADTTIAPARDAHKEIDLWRPFLRRFPHGEQKYVHWSFWPSTVFTRDAGQALLDLFTNDKQLQEIMDRSRIWATEEIVLPTLVALLGYRIMAHPCTFDFVKYRVSFTQQQVDHALARSDAFWIHPVPRRYDNRLRTHIRLRSNHFEITRFQNDRRDEDDDGPALLRTLPILKAMKKVEGWLREDEADLLIAACHEALATLPQPGAIVEVGSYCGRATLVLGAVARTVCPQAKVYAIDRHDGRVGARDQGVTDGPPTREKFEHTIAGAGLEETVVMIQKRAADVAWERPVTFLLIDGLHDYASIASDFFHFEAWLIPGSIIAFHDYADYFPGVKAFVHELLASGAYRKVACVHTMMVLQRR